MILWKRPWCWERVKAGGERDNRGWDGWMASPTQWTWIWASSRRWQRTGETGVLQSMGSQGVGQDLGAEQQWSVKSVKLHTTLQPLVAGYVISRISVLLGIKEQGQASLLHFGWTRFPHMFLSLKLQIFIKRFRCLIHTHTHTHMRFFKHAKSRGDKNKMQYCSIWAQKDSVPQSTKILGNVQRTLSTTYLEILMH